MICNCKPINSELQGVPNQIRPRSMGLNYDLGDKSENLS